MKNLLYASSSKSILLILFLYNIYDFNAQTVTTLAGSTSGYADGVGIAAQFNGCTGVTVAPNGDIYVADWLNNRIRKVTPSGVVTTIAGSNSGYADGTLSSALFYNPMDIAVDNAGNLYIADTGNHRIRKITTDGMVSTLAGGTIGANDGTGSAAQFYYPEGVAVDSGGNVYVGDASNHRIRKITPSGVTTTLAGSTYGYADGTGSAAQFWTPSGLDVDSSGNVFVAEKQNHRIRKITPSGVVTTVAGTGVSGFADGTASTAKFKNPFDVTVDSAGNIYVADYGNHKIRKIGTDNTVITYAGSTIGYLDGEGTLAKFNYPIGIAFANDGTFYVVESGGHKVRKIVDALASDTFDALQQVILYPNPTSSSIYLEMPTHIVKSYSVWNVNASILFSKTINDLKTTIELDDLTSGIYIIQLNTSDNSFFRKIIKL